MEDGMIVSLRENGESHSVEPLYDNFHAQSFGMNFALSLNRTGEIGQWKMKKTRYEVNYFQENQRLKAKLRLVKDFQAPPPKIVPIKKSTVERE
jgi:hypothetical protein